MKKKLIGMLCGAVAVSVAVPAFADHTIGGFFRTQGYVQNVAMGKDKRAEQFIVQRLRAKWTNKINDLVSVVWFGEVDTDWGQKSKGAIGEGGALSADGINVETKNVYADLKPSKDFPVMFRIGIQGFGDDIQSIYFNEDAAALVAVGQFDAVGVTAGYSKWTENALDRNDDNDLYFALVNVKASDAVKAGMDIFYNNNAYYDNPTKTGDARTLTVAPFVNANVAGLGIDGFLAYQHLKSEVAGKSVKGNAFAASANVTAKLDPATLGFRVIYFGKDGTMNDDSKNAFQGDVGGLSFMNEGLYIFLTDLAKTNLSGDRKAIAVEKAGYGLLGAVAKAKMDLPNNSFAKCALGYFTALTDSVDGGKTKKDGKGLGFEVAAEVGTKVGEVATLSLRGSYAFLGSFYNGSAKDKNGKAADPDNAYMTALMVNIPF